MPDFDALARDGGGDPPAGIHVAWLNRCELKDTRNGEKVLCEWQTDDEPPYSWTSWSGFSPQALIFTQELMDALGIDRAAIAAADDKDEAFADALHEATGKQYNLRIEVNANGYLNTYVMTAADLEKETDVSIDTEGLPVPGADVADDMPDF